MPVTVTTSAFTELDTATAYALWRLRQDVFVVEQDAPYPDLDGRDTEAATRHVVATDDTGAVVGTLRVLDDGDTRRIGRVVVARSARGTGVGDALLVAGLAVVGARPCVLHAQAHLADWYARHGFTVTGAEFLEDGIPHVPMRREAAD